MTAEVAIINQYGIAIAADSAVTIGEKRVWKTSNKIFSLGPMNDIAVMIYGNGEFSGYPWELIIKSFKRHFSSSRFDTVEHCKDQFVEFLRKPEWSSQLQSSLCVFTIILKELSDLKEQCSSGNSRIFRKSVKDLLEKWIAIARSRPFCISNLTKENFLKEYRKEIDDLRNEAFNEHFPKYLRNLLDEYLFEYFVRAECDTDFKSGVVFCGYGETEYRPALHELLVDGRYNDSVRAWNGRRAAASNGDSVMAQIIPFAQRDMTNLFMEGLSAAYGAYFFRLIENLLEKKSKEIVKVYPGSQDEKKVESEIQQRIDTDTLEKIRSDFNSFRNSKFIQPLMANVSSLPREEMAAMAEALVELTSLRRKIDSTLESVAGPVDVMFISKPDGVIWIKRKHYFDRELNGEFFMRKNLDTN